MRKKIKEQKISWPEGKWPKHMVIDIDGYERNWMDSTQEGHQMRVVRQDGSTIEINMKWPKGYNPRLYSIDR